MKKILVLNKPRRCLQLNKNSEKRYLKILWIFPKRTGPQPVDFLVFLIACFIPKEKQLGKNNFHFRWQRPLFFEEVYFSRRNLLIKNLQLIRLYWGIS